MTGTSTHEYEAATARRRGEAVSGRSRHHSFGFWVAALAFLVNMGFSAVPTPLYALYQRRDHFSTFTVTIVYAVYAVGVIGSLFLGGHVSDWVGRKRVFVPALLVNVVSASVFLLAPSLPGLLAARVISGVSVGLTTATATAYLAELHTGIFGSESPRRAQVVATAANLGGIGVGPLVAGLLAQFAPLPLRLPYVVFAAVLVLLAVLVALAPETAPPQSPRAVWRPQRIAVPVHARGAFLAATAAGAASFAVYGVFNSIAPSLLSGTLHENSPAVSGAVAFAAFAAGAVAQIALNRTGMLLTLRVSRYVLLPGLVMIVGGMWLASLAVFVIGGAVTGAGAGLLFRGALVAAGASAPSGARAEVLAGYFLGAYVGLSLPVVGLGVATRYFAAKDVMVVFVVIIAVAVIGSVGSTISRATRSL
jgi:hypothetical protein